MKKILLAENDTFLISIYANQLRKSGYSTSIARDGEIVIDRIKDISPDLLILDSDLPKTEGFSILKRLREDAGIKELKVVMLSNFFQEGNIDENTELGVIKYFSKAENTSEEIVAEIKRILN